MKSSISRIVFTQESIRGLLSGTAVGNIFLAFKL